MFTKGEEVYKLRENTSSRDEKREEERYNKIYEDKETKSEDLSQEQKSPKNSQTFAEENESNEPQRNDTSQSSQTSKKIFDLLVDDDDQGTQIRNDRRDERYPLSNNQYSQNSQARNDVSKKEYNLPPKLSEINTGVVRDNKGVRDITRGLTKQEEEEETEKRMMLEKFSILKKKYKEAKIPDFTTYTDLGTMRRTYETTVRNLQLDATVDNYKRYLMLGFGGTQWLIQKFLKVDMTGFAEQQILSINQYESLLIEIGEKSYFKTNTASPEVRLMFLIGFNAVIFVMTKMMFNSTSSFMKPSSTTSASSDNKNKPHMKGPSFDDLKDFENVSKKTKNE